VLVLFEEDDEGRGEDVEFCAAPASMTVEVALDEAEASALEVEFACLAAFPFPALEALIFELAAVLVLFLPPAFWFFDPALLPLCLWCFLFVPVAVDVELPAMVELEGRAEEVLFDPADTSTDVALRAVAVELAEETTDEVLFAFDEASVDVPLRAVDVELDDATAAEAVLLPPLLAAAADLVPLPEDLVLSLVDAEEAAFVVMLLALAAVATLALEPAAAVPEAAPWDTTTQLPKFPAVLKETRHLFPDAPPVHLVPAGI